MVMDPLLSVNKTYSEILDVEKQHELHVSLTDSTDSSVMMVQLEILKSYDAGKRQYQKEI